MPSRSSLGGCFLYRRRKALECKRFAAYNPCGRESRIF